MAEPAKPQASVKPSVTITKGASKGGGAGAAGAASAGTVSAAAGAAGAGGGKRSRVDWRAVWPIPAALGAAALLVGGLAVGIMRAPKADPTLPLREAQGLVEEGRFEEAIEVVNLKVAPGVREGSIGRERHIEMLLLRARAIAQGQVKLAIDRAENHASVIADLDAAVDLGHVLTPDESVMLASALVATGKSDRALEIVRKLPESENARRQAMLMRIVEQNLRAKNVQYDATLEILSKMMESPKLSADERAWLVAKQAELRLAVGADDEAIGQLLRVLPRMEGVSKELRGELAYLLGRAYFQLAEKQRADPALMTQAERQLESSLELLDVTSARRVEAQLMIGRVMQGTGRSEEAKEAFAKLRSIAPGESTPPNALLGLAEAMSATGDDDGAIATYAELIDGLGRVKDGAAPVRVDALGPSLMERQADRFVREDFPRALQYAQLAERVYKKAGEVPGPVLLALAQSHRRVAMAALAEAKESRAALGAGAGGGHGAGGGDSHKEAGGAEHGDEHGAAKDAGAGSTAGKTKAGDGDAHGAGDAHGSGDGHGAGAGAGGVSVVTANEAKRHFFEAGLNFRAHADTVVVSDDKAYGESMFSAGDCFDQAADRAGAKAAFSTYIEGAADDDPRRHEARFRLAQIFQAEQDHAAAIELYRRLAGITLKVENGKASIAPDPDGARAGEWGDRSMVPLARSLLSDGKAGGDQMARLVLDEVISGRRVGPKSDIFRDAITELGEIEHMSGVDYAKAIGLLRRAEGYEKHPRIGVVRYKLADSSRLSAAEIQGELRQTMPQARRSELEVVREERLRVAQAKFQEVIDDLGSQPGAGLSASERVMLRNSAFYVADCVFDLGRDFTGAIGLYDQAAQRYANDPSALVARTQIVAAYVAMGKWDEARRAHDLAKRQLQLIPEQALNDPNLPMQRRHWQKWFDAQTELERRAGAQADANAAKSP